MAAKVLAIDAKLPHFRGIVEEIRQLLGQAGYTSKVIDVDHEEHWLCQPN
jgi:hypothetical protein